MQGSFNRNIFKEMATVVDSLSHFHDAGRKITAVIGGSLATTEPTEPLIGFISQIVLLRENLYT